MPPSPDPTTLTPTKYTYDKQECKFYSGQGCSVQYGPDYLKTFDYNGHGTIGCCIIRGGVVELSNQAHT